MKVNKPKKDIMKKCPMLPLFCVLFGISITLLYFRIACYSDMTMEQDIASIYIPGVTIGMFIEWLGRL